MITFWRTETGKTLRVERSAGSWDIPIDQAKMIIDLLKDSGFIVTDHGDRITVE